MRRVGSGHDPRPGGPPAARVSYRRIRFIRRESPSSTVHSVAARSSTGQADSTRLGVGERALVDPTNSVTGVRRPPDPGAGRRRPWRRPISRSRPVHKSHAAIRNGDSPGDRTRHRSDRGADGRTSRGGPCRCRAPRDGGSHSIGHPVQVDLGTPVRGEPACAVRSELVAAIASPRARPGRVRPTASPRDPPPGHSRSVVARSSQVGPAVRGDGPPESARPSRPRDPPSALTTGSTGPLRLVTPT